MKVKKSIMILDSYFIPPVEIGERALIQCKNGRLLTSRVVTIHRNQLGLAVVETQNSIYTAQMPKNF